MVEESESMGAVGAISSTDSTATYESLPNSANGQSASTAGAPAAIVAKPTAARGARAATPTPAAPAVTGTQTAPNQPPTAQELASVAQQANTHLATMNRVVKLTVDQDSGLTIATIRNSQTGEVLQQFPSANIVHLAQLLAEWSPGKSVMLDLIA